MSTFPQFFHNFIHKKRSGCPQNFPSFPKFRFPFSRADFFVVRGRKKRDLSTIPPDLLLLLIILFISRNITWEESRPLSGNENLRKKIADTKRFLLAKTRAICYNIRKARRGRAQAFLFGGRRYFRKSAGQMTRRLSREVTGMKFICEGVLLSDAAITVSKAWRVQDDDAHSRMYQNDRAERRRDAGRLRRGAVHSEKDSGGRPGGGRNLRKRQIFL